MSPIRWPDLPMMPALLMSTSIDRSRRRDGSTCDARHVADIHRENVDPPCCYPRDRLRRHAPAATGSRHAAHAATTVLRVLTDELEPYSPARTGDEDRAHRNYAPESVEPVSPSSRRTTDTHSRARFRR